MATEDPDRLLRVSDAERETVAQRLQRALTEGRLTVREFDERTRDAYAALTRADLAELTADLPQEEPAPPEQDGHWLDWVVTLGVLTVVWTVLSVVTGGLTPFLPAIPIGVWALVMLTGTLFRDGPRN